MLHIKDLCVSVIDDQESKPLLKNCSWSIRSGSVCLLMGPNGSGKSSLLYTLLGHPDYQVTAGSVQFFEQNLLALPTYKRARQGIFLAMQDPEAIPGLDVITFLKSIYEVHFQKSIAAAEFLDKAKSLMQIVGLAESILYRSVHEGFSGGEKKRFELAQMLMLQPKLCLLDEIDSGLDVDGLLLLAQCLQAYRQKFPDTAFIIITHVPSKLMQYIQPDQVCVMLQGTLVARGGNELLQAIAKHGYEPYAQRVE